MMNIRTGVDLVDSLLARPTSDLASTIIERPALIVRGRLPDLGQHLDQVESEFGGRDQLSFLHAALIVLIRREISLPSSLAAFQNLWDADSERLCHRLDLRWLVAACDTFADHAASEVDAVRALLASTLTNTVKLYETERRLTGSVAISRNMIETSAEDTPWILFDGLTRFGIERGDMVRQLLNRLENANADRNDPVQRLTVEVINRVLSGPTVFQRFSTLHRGDTTRWGPIHS
jgi:hypothetical protein